MKYQVICAYSVYYNPEDGQIVDDLVQEFTEITAGELPALPAQRDRQYKRGLMERTTYSVVRTGEMTKDEADALRVFENQNPWMCGDDVYFLDDQVVA